AESLETTRIYSAMGLLKPGQPLMAIRPFRPPHHSVSDAGLVGGGSTPQPGEISLAHKGVLFLDEMPEFNRKTLEVLRQPLEARGRQWRRFGPGGRQVNGRMPRRQVRKFCVLKPEAMAILKAAMEDLGLSARAHDKVLRVARTIADLEGQEEIKPQHIAEAV